MNTENSVYVSFSGGLQITPKLGFSASYIVLNFWRYTPKDVTVATSTGPAEPQRISNPVHYDAQTWGMVSFDYEAMDEMTVSLGYYNLSGQLDPNGQRRNPLWSPDARIFFTLTGNLDAIYERFRTKPAAPVETARR
jgi:hypothetical protein